MFKSEVWNKYIALSNTVISFGKILERAIKENKSSEGLEELAFIIDQEAHALKQCLINSNIQLDTEITPAKCDK